MTKSIMIIIMSTNTNMKIAAVVTSTAITTMGMNAGMQIAVAPMNMNIAMSMNIIMGMTIQIVAVLMSLVTTMGMITIIPNTITAVMHVQSAQNLR